MIKELVIDGSSKDFVFKKVSFSESHTSFVIVPVAVNHQAKPIPIEGYEVIVFNDKTVDLQYTALGEMKPEGSSQAFMNQFALDLWASINDASMDDNEGSFPYQSSQKISDRDTHHPTAADDIPENSGGIQNIRINQTKPLREESYSNNRQEEPLSQTKPASSSPRGRVSEKNESQNQDAQDSNIASALRQYDSSSNTDNNNNNGSTDGGNGNPPPTPQPPAPTYNYAAQTFYGNPNLTSLTGDAGNDTFYTFSSVVSYTGNLGIDTLVGVDTSHAIITQSSLGIYEITASAFNTSMNDQGNPSQQDTFQMSNVRVDSIEQFKYETNGTLINSAQLTLPTQFNDTIETLHPQESFVMDGSLGNDRISGGQTDDTLLGNEGNDVLIGGSNNLIQNHDFQETLDGGYGNDTLTYLGVTNSNYVAGDSIQATLIGGEGDDDLQIKIDTLSSVAISGGLGQDTLSLNQSLSRYSLWDASHFNWQYILQDQSYLIQMSSLDAGNLFNLTESDASLESLKLSFSPNANSYHIARPLFASAETVIGTDGNDIFFSSDRTSFMNAGLGDDIVVISNQEKVELGEGTNQLFSATSDVTLSYAWASHEVDLNLSQKLGLAYDQDSNLIALDRINRLIENAEGGNGQDTIVGNTLNNHLWGLDGHDTIISGGGDDFIYGGDGDDTLTVNGQGHATLEGGDGSDQFRLNFNLTDGSKATITDFNAGTLDHVFLYLDQFSGASGTYFNQYEVKDASQNLLYSGAIDHEGSAILSLTLNQENNLLSFNYNQTSYAILESEVFDIDLIFNQHLIDISYL